MDAHETEQNATPWLRPIVDPDNLPEIAEARAFFLATGTTGVGVGVGDSTNEVLQQKFRSWRSSCTYSRLDGPH